MSGGGYRPPQDRPRTAVQPRPPRLSGDPNYTGRHREAGWQDTGTMAQTDLDAARDHQDTAGVSSFVVSHLRTLVPILWGAAITWGATQIPQVPQEWATDPTVLAVVDAFATYAWYALWRWLEPHIPRALVALLLGHPAEPAYGD